MAQEKAEFAVELKDKTSASAASASQALEKLRNAIKADTKELAAMQAAMKRMQQGSSVNIAAARELQKQIDAQKSKIAEAEAKYVSLGGTFSDTGGSARKSGSAIKDLGQQMGSLPGPIGRAGSSLSTLVGGMTSGIAVAVGFVAVLVAVGAAVIAAGASLAAFGIQAASARRSQELHFEAISRMRRGFIGLRASASDVMAAIDDVAGSTATSRESVSRFAEILQRGGVRGANLRDALNAASIRAAALGDESGEAFARLAVGASRSGVSIRRLADDVQARFGGIAARRLLDLTVLSGKLRENWDRLFDGLDLGPLGKLVSTVVGLFSQSTASGRALKAIIASVFQPLIGAVDDTEPFVKRFFQGIIIGALHVAIALAKVRRWWRQTFAPAKTEADALTAAVWMGKIALGGLALVAVAGLSAIASVALTIAAPFLMAYAAIRLVIALGRGLIRAWNGISAEWSDIGGKLVDGLVNGIRNGLTRAKDAVRSVGNAIVSEWRDLLQIRSPSRVFAGLGRQIPAGVAMGVDQGAPAATAAVSDMLSIPDAIGAAGSRGSVSISIGDIYVTGANAAEQAEDLRAQLSRILEEVGLTMGAATS